MIMGCFHRAPSILPSLAGILVLALLAAPVRGDVQVNGVNLNWLGRQAKSGYETAKNAAQRLANRGSEPQRGPGVDAQLKDPLLKELVRSRNDATRIGPKLLPMARAYFRVNDIADLAVRAAAAPDIPPAARTDLLLMVGRHLAVQGPADQARFCFHEILRQDPRFSVAVAGLVESMAHPPPPNVTAANLGNPLSPDHTRALIRILIEEEFSGWASLYAQDLVENDPKNPDSWTALGDARRQAGDLSAAERAYARSFELLSSRLPETGSAP